MMWSALARHLLPPGIRVHFMSARDLEKVGESGGLTMGEYRWLNRLVEEVGSGPEDDTVFSSENPRIGFGFGGD